MDKREELILFSAHLKTAIANGFDGQEWSVESVVDKWIEDHPEITASLADAVASWQFLRNKRDRLKEDLSVSKLERKDAAEHQRGEQVGFEYPHPNIIYARIRNVSDRISLLEEQLEDRLMNQ